MRRSRPWLAATFGAIATVLSFVGIAFAADTTVSISGFAFHPATATIGVGERVTWTNDDTTAHSATATGVLTFNSGDLDPGASYTAAFPTAGSYEYICAIHPTMTGLVVVRAAGLTPAPTDTAPTTALVAARDGGVAPASLAFLGVAMLGGACLTWRRLRERG